MNYVTIYTATTITPPFSGTACDFFGNNCSYIGSGTTFPVTFYLPSQFNSAPVLQLTLTDSLGCKITETIYCVLEGSPKQFQNLQYYFFMDGTQFNFQ
jgi:hypothetical protein